MQRSKKTTNTYTPSTTLNKALMEAETALADATNHFRTRLIEGVQNNDVALVINTLKNSPVDPCDLIKSKNDDRFVKLSVYAAECGYWQIVEELPKLRKETNKNEYGYANALFLAVSAKQWEAAKSLVMGRADLSLRIDNKTIAMTMIYKPVEAEEIQWPFIDWLATHIKSPGKDEYEYGNPLLDAVVYNRKKTAGLLLKAGAQLSWHLSSTYQFSPHVAIAANNLEMLNVIIPYMQPFDFGRQNTNKQTPLALACSLQHWECALALISAATSNHLLYDDSVADSIIRMLQANQTQLAITALRKIAEDKTAENDYTLLHWAVAANLVRVVAYIIDHHLGSQTSLSKNGLTPIELACKNGFTPTATLLIEKAQNPQFNLLAARQMHYDEALLNVIHFDSKPLAKLLLQHGARCRRWNSEIGNIFLFAAIQKKSLHMVNLLIDNGADPFCQNKHGKNSIDIAKSETSDSFAQKIKDHLAKHNSNYSYYTPLTYSMMADVLLDYTIEELQQQANFHRNNLHDQAVELPKCLEVLQQVTKCQRAILIHHLDELVTQRTSMEQRIKANLKEGPIANLPLEVEIQHCSDLIRYINLLLANPNEHMPLERLHHHLFAAGKDIVNYVHAVGAINTFKLIINQRLTDLVAAINDTKFVSTHVTRTLWLPGKPEPIKNILAICAKRSSVMSIKNIFAIYCSVLETLADGRKQEKQHPDTTQFLERYYHFFSKIDFNFCKQQNPAAPAMVNPISYEEIAKQMNNQLTQFIK